jgi:hypothetical protein
MLYTGITESARRRIKMKPDMSIDAVGEYTCSCPISICAWTSWAECEQLRDKKETAHVKADHPEELGRWLVEINK